MLLIASSYKNRLENIVCPATINPYFLIGATVQKFVKRKDTRA